MNDIPEQPNMNKDPASKTAVSAQLVLGHSSGDPIALGESASLAENQSGCVPCADVV